MRKQIALTACFLSLAVLAVYATTRVAFSQDGEKPLSPEPDVKSLIERLGAPEFAARQEAETQLLKLGKDAVPALTEAMKGHPDAHIRFEAERLLDRIGRGEAAAPAGPAPAPGLPGDIGRSVREMLRRLEEHGLLRIDDLDRWSKLFEGQFGTGARGMRQFSSSDGHGTLSFTETPDGKVQVTIEKDGKTETYEAGSLDELRERFPQVYAQIEPMIGSFRVEVGKDPFGGFFEGLRPWNEMPRVFPRGAVPWGPDGRLVPEPAPGVPGGFKLGVWVGEMTDVLRHHLKLGPSEGVLVEDVVPGSLASRLGLAKFDVIVKVAGKSVGSAEDIRSALTDVKEGASVEAEVIREGAPLKLMATR